MSSLDDVRREYTGRPLGKDQAGHDPFALFGRWLEEAIEVNRGAWFEPNAMALATATPDGAPSVRIVLLKSFDESGLVFFTWYTSRKGR